ncbi:MAG: succinate dehydrogenase assembly factor 2 [Methylococcales bacterium]|nr:succinate dehydrogenase assembly factor 2 [Methylococcales bacterium]
MNTLAKLTWQCRRGTLELDVLLQRYLANAYTNANEQEQDAFRVLLQLEDDLLLGYLLGDQTPNTPALRRLVKHICNTASTLPSN